MAGDLSLWPAPLTLAPPRLVAERQGAERQGSPEGAADASPCRPGAGGHHAVANATTRYRTATGATVEPVAPCSFSGCMIKANS
jgi:hypothetical protein